MASRGTFVNPQSKTVASRPAYSLGINKPTDSIFLGEVLDVVYLGKQAGCIVYRSGKSSQNMAIEAVQNIAQPLLANVKTYPIKGELVLIFVFGYAYYLPLNALNNPSVNKVPVTRFSKTLNDQKTDAALLTPTTYNLSGKKLYVTPSYEGDVVFEGRFGQSIKLGSTIKYQNEPVTVYSKSDLSEAGDPITIIRNGAKSAEENILLDDSSIYMCSTQKIIVDNKTNGFEGITGAWSTLNVNSVESQDENDPGKLTAQQVEIATEQRDSAIKSKSNSPPNSAGSQAASERANYLNAQIESGQANALPVSGSTSGSTGPAPTQSTTAGELRKRIIAYAQQDAAIPTTENPYASNYSPRINEMLSNCGLNNQAQYQTKGEGYYWCAAAVTTWYKDAGADIPPSGQAGVSNWYKWALNKGTFSSKPVPGAAIIYGTTSNPHHIGIVESVGSDGTVITIEGNTCGENFDRNGTGCFKKKPNPKSRNIVGYVIPSKNGVITA